ncbi:MAG: ammonium transporter, partial [Bifidobacterium sp.]
LLGVELLGVVAVAAWTTVTMIIIFWVIKHTVGLRVSAKEELSGLDLPEHGLVAAYADFEPSVLTKSEDSYEARVAREAEAEAAGAAGTAGAPAKEAAAAK